MSDQGELGRHWAVPADDVTDYDIHERPTGPIPQVSEVAGASTPESPKPVDSVESTDSFAAESVDFVTEFRDTPIENGESAAPVDRLDFSTPDPVLSPSADFELEVPDVADEATRRTAAEPAAAESGAAEPTDAGTETAAGGRPPSVPPIGLFARTVADEDRAAESDQPGGPAAGPDETDYYGTATTEATTEATTGTEPGGSWEGRLFDGAADEEEGDPRYVGAMPSGPSTPPKPGMPSSGNWRMPEWMGDDDAAADAAEGKSKKDKKKDRKNKDKSKSQAPPAEQHVAGAVPAAGAMPTGGPSAQPADGGGKSSKLMLIGGVSVLVIALIAAAAVFLLKPSGSESEGNQAEGAAQQVQAPKVELPPEKPFPQFRGTPTTMVGQVDDTFNGLSYPRFGPPYVLPTKQNKLGQSGWSGQQIVVTERLDGQVWYGQFLTGTLGPTEQTAWDGPGSEKTTAAVVLQGIMQRYYGFQHKSVPLASQALDVDGHKGWLISSYLSYKRPGLRANKEVVAVAVIDTGRELPAVVLMAMPNTHRKLWTDMNAFLGRLKVVG